uniref:Selenocysteine lyase n=1 Tax=Clytia hemisphaerica TaxID=252671 RepID=A0A7M5X4S3_9CNID
MVASNGTSTHTNETDTENRIFMDYNATTPLAPSVIKVIGSSLVTGWANPSSSYQIGVKAKQMITEARHHLLKMINGSKESELTFTSGGTEANNHMIWMACKYFNEFHKEHNRINSKKPHIITSCIEHDSILNPLKELEREGRVDVTYVNVSKEHGFVDPDNVLQEIRDETVLVTLMMANNETGVIQKVAEICKRIKALPRRDDLPRILLHTDAAQTIGKIPVDVQELNVDYLTIVGHKFYGPRIGAFWVRDGLPYFPMMLGGGQECGRRAGTENTPMITGLGEAARLVCQNLKTDTEYLREIRDYLIQRLRQEVGAENIQVNCGHVSSRLPNTANISFINSKLDGRGILARCSRLAASVGAACHTDCGAQASGILLAHHVTFEIAIKAVRLSVGRHTTKEEVDIIVQDLKQAVLS